MIYSPERFVMPRMHHTADRATLTDPERLAEWVKAAVLGQLPVYWESERAPKAKYSQKVVGEDFEKRVLESPKDALLLVSHPVKAKNGRLPERFEEFARREKATDLLIGRYNGVNESQSFKSPERLPAVLYFRRLLDAQGQPTGEPKEVQVLEDINDLLLRGSTDEDVQAALLEFLNKCRKQ